MKPPRISPVINYTSVRNICLPTASAFYQSANSTSSFFFSSSISAILRPIACNSKRINIKSVSLHGFHAFDPINLVCAKNHSTTATSASNLASITTLEIDVDGPTRVFDGAILTTEELDTASIVSSSSATLPTSGPTSNATITEQHRQFFDHVARELNLQSLDDWYLVSAETLRQRFAGAKQLLRKHYGKSLIRALLAVYPEHPWEITKFSRVPSGYWTDPQNQRRQLDKIANDLGIQKWQDWYNVTLPQVRSLCGRSFIDKYFNGSLSQALRVLYPEHPWQDAKFSKAPNNFWDDKNNHRVFFEQLAQELNIEELDDWYDVTLEDVRKHGGGGLLQSHYGNSLIRALKALYPEHPWREASSEKKVPRGYWKDPNNHRQFFDNLAQELNIQKMEDWYNVSVADVCERGGAGLLKEYYNNSLLRALRAVYPEHSWDPFASGAKLPLNFWKDESNQREFFDRLAQQLHLESLDDWYDVTAEEVRARGGAGLLKGYHNNSLVTALQAIYPEHDWQPWRFRHIKTASHSSSQQFEDIREYIATLASQLNIQHLDDWYRVSADHIRDNCSLRLIQHSGGLYLVLKRLYPEHSWDPKRFSTSLKKSSQRMLLMAVTKLFPDVETVEDFLHPSLAFSDTHHKMELDIYLPSLSLAFEYHGKHHYKDLYFFGATSKYQTTDSEKVAACHKAGITLISVPYWWDRTVESLAATIHLTRPDLIPHGTLSQGAVPIPMTPPQEPTMEDMI